MILFIIPCLIAYGQTKTVVTIELPLGFQEHYTIGWTGRETVTFPRTPMECYEDCLNAQDCCGYVTNDDRHCYQKYTTSTGTCNLVEQTDYVGAFGAGLIVPARQYSTYSGQQCVGTDSDILRDFVGTIEECKRKCDELQCIGFIRVNSGEFEEKCYFRGGEMETPYDYTADDRDCYLPAGDSDHHDAAAYILDLTNGKVLGEESEPCSDHSDCASGWCEADICVNLRAKGETCTMSAVEFAGQTGSTMSGDAAGTVIEVVLKVGLSLVGGSAADSLAEMAGMVASELITDAIANNAQICEPELACCGGICQSLVEDWAKINYCESECKAGVTCPAGSCSDNNDRSSGEECGCSDQCADGLTCCDGKCASLEKDWANIDYCPHECKAGAFCPSGSCSDDFSVGESCSCDEQCSGDLGCCDGKCTAKETDWAGFDYCPNECKKGALCPNGSCDDMMNEFDSCSCDEQCVGDMSCCDGQCRYKEADWAGIHYCPHECSAGIGCSGGSCPNNRGAGETCWCRGQCNTGCCEGGKCVEKVMDWAGIAYCPSECSAGIGCGSGSCPVNRGTGSSCNCRGQCSSGCCENGKCVNKLRDWAGIYYCPSECNGGCGAGSCPNNRGAGQKCSCRGQCNTGCCEGGRCVHKKKDWAGVYYCPAECKGSIFGSHGSC